MSGLDARQVLRTCIRRLEEGADATTDDARPSPSLGQVTLLPHQVDGAERLRALLARHGGALLADEVGTGKTYTALRAVHDAGAVLVVAPAALRSMWEEACRRCAVHADVVSYERLSAAREIPSPRWAVVVLDEAHHARTPGTRRYRAVATLSRGAGVLLLTATPIHNRRRDLRALLALFLGAAAQSLDDAEVSAFIVRRRADVVARPLPTLTRVLRHAVPRSDAVLQALHALPPPLPPADGGIAQALVALQLTRAWSSSDAALVAAVRRRLVTAAALEQSLEAGRLPSRRELVTWTGDVDGSVQLAFPELVAAPLGGGSVAAALAVVRAHAAALRGLRSLVRGHAGRDAARFAILARLLDGCGTRQAVLFTHSAETAEAVFAALRGRFRLALLTGRGAALASGAVPRREVLAAFAPAEPGAGGGASPPAHRRIDVLVATDVLSEGVDLQRAGVVIHLDLPWTVARLEQRMGRLRRIGSPHAQVEAHLVTPPSGAQELEATLAHLVHKARTAGALLGASSVLGDATQWRGILPPLAELPATSARSALVGVLRALERHVAGTDAGRPSGGDRGTCPQRGPRDVLPDGSARCAVAAGASDGLPPVRWQLPQLHEPLSVALVTVAGSPQLVLSREDGITADPVGVVERLATLLQRLDGARTNDRPGGAGATGARSTDTAHGSNPLPPTPPLAIEQRIRTWCRHRHAELQLLAPTGQRSASHRRLMHALDALPARAPRARRARVAAAAAEARRLALALRGAGAEQLFDQLTHRRPHEGCPSTCDAAGAATRASARARTSTRPASPPDASRASATPPAVTHERDALEEPRLDERWLDEHWLDGVLAALRAASPAASSTPPGGVATHAPGRGVATAPPLPLDDPAPSAPSALVRLDAMLTLLPPATAHGSG